MLLMKTNKFDMCEISQILAKYDIKARVESNQIYLEAGDYPDELLEKLNRKFQTSKVLNYKEEDINQIIKENQEDEAITKHDHFKNMSGGTDFYKVIEEYELIYPVIKYGEAYLCDFGDPYGSEQGYMRPAIVIENMEMSMKSNTTIVVPCTTNLKRNLSNNFAFEFCEKNMLDRKFWPGAKKTSVAITNQIRVIDKTRLRKFIGTMTPEFMNELSEKIAIQLSLKNGFKPKKPVPKAIKGTQLNEIQIQLFEYVDVHEFFNILSKEEAENSKAEKILELFGFTFKANGENYVLEAILIAPDDKYFNLEMLCESIAEKEIGIDKDEVKRLIIARVKEKFKFKKSPAIEFIRLIKSFL